MFICSKYQEEIVSLIQMQEINYENGYFRKVNYQKRFLGCYVFESPLTEVTQMKTNTGFSAIVIITNFKMLKKIGLTEKEIRSILAHEAGHFRISSREYDCIETEYQADKYSVKKFGKINLISAMLKLLNIYINTSKKDTVNELCLRLNKLGISVNLSSNEFFNS